MNRICYSTIIASIVSMISLAISANHTQKNILAYLICLCCYAISFVIIFFSPVEYREQKTKGSFRVCVVLAIVIIIYGVLYIIKSQPFYGYEAWILIPKWVILGLTVLFSLQMFNCVYCRRGGGEKKKDAMSYGRFILLLPLFMLYPDIIRIF